MEDSRPAENGPISALACLELPGPVLVLAPQPFYEDRGTPIAIREVLKALSENGREVHLLTYPMGEEITLPNLSVFRIPNPLRIRRVPIGFSLRKVILDQILTAALFWRLRMNKYSCIHAVEEMAFPAVFLAKSAGIPVLWDMQSDMPEQLRQFRIFRSRAVQRLLRRCERWVIHRADAIVCSSGLEPHVVAANPRARVCEWRFPSIGGDVSDDSAKELRAQLAIPDQAPVILYMGNFAPYQGIGVLVEAARLAVRDRPDLVFLFVGADDPHHLPEGSDDLVDRGALKIVQRQPRSRMPAYLAIADVVVSPRCVDGNIPLKIFDYMAAGKPIVATKIASHETMLNTERAILVEATGEGIANGILGCLQDTRHSGQIAKEAQKFARKSLTWLAFSQEVARLHQNLVFGTDRDERS